MSKSSETGHSGMQVLFAVIAIFVGCALCAWSGDGELKAAGAALLLGGLGSLVCKRA